MEKNMEMENNIIMNFMKMEIYYLKVNFWKEKKMEKELNIIKVEKYYLKDNILMEKEMGKERNMKMMEY